MKLKALQENNTPPYRLVDFRISKTPLLRVKEKIRENVQFLGGERRSTFYSTLFEPRRDIVGMEQKSVEADPQSMKNK